MWRKASVATLSLLCLATAPNAQVRRAEVPPIPQQERFVARSDLTVRLELVTDRVQIDQRPQAKLILRNVGTKRLLIRKPAPEDAIYPNPHIQVYASSGERLYGLSSMCQCFHTLTRISDMIALEPQREYQIEVTAPYVFLPQGTELWRTAAHLEGLPPGDYFLRAVYRNAPDSHHELYDVYEAGAGQVWEGWIETAPVHFTVMPPDAARLRELTLTITGPGNADAAIRAVTLARAAGAGEALVRRFQSDPRSRLAVVAALDAIGSADANERLLNWLEALPEQVRRPILFDPFVPSGIASLMTIGSGCAGAKLVGQLSMGFSGDGSFNGLRALARRCPAFAAEARNTITALTTNPPSNPSIDNLNPARNAIARLGAIADATDVPLLLAIARRQSPSLVFLRSSDRDYAATDLAQRAAFAVRSIAQAHLRQVLQEHVQEPRDAYLGEVRHALDGVSDEALQTFVPELLTAEPASIVTMIAALRDAHVAQRSAEIEPPAPAERVTVATVREMAARLSDARADVQVEALTFLTEHGDGSMTLRFVDLVRSPNVDVRHRAVEAIARVGTASAFTPLRNMLVHASDETAHLVDGALRDLTFTAVPRGRLGDLERWDEWWRRNRHLTRWQWAEHAVAAARRDPTSSDMPAVKAIEYLATLPKPALEVLERATRSQAWQVRRAAATAIAKTDSPRGMALLARELDNRRTGVCGWAAETLATLANVSHQFNCGVPAERERAKEFWEARLARN